MTFREPPIPLSALSPMLLREISMPTMPRRRKAMRIGIQITSILLKHDAVHTPARASCKQGLGGNYECDLLE